MVAVRITEIDRVGNFMILEFELDAATFQFLLGSKKTIAISAKGQMKHPDTAANRRCRPCMRAHRKQCNSGLSLTDESRNAIPHTFVKALEPEDFDIPVRRSLSFS